jgi:hypothetical protein
METAWDVAIHEAAHAVVGLYFGFRLDYILIHARADGRGAGRATWSVGCTLTQDQLRGELCRLAAGPVALWIYAHQQWLGWKDRRRALDEFLSHQHGGAHDFMMIQNWLRRQQPRITDRQLRGAQLKIIKDSASLVQSRWTQVVAIAEALHSPRCAGYLEGHVAQAIIRSTPLIDPSPG